jgi:phosphopantothenoylcysteine decarboxylase / phosphopantothenate---cysteine ligase
MLTGKHIILGVTGGIAAYKSVLIVRECVRAGAEVQVVMTRSATQFVTPLTFSTLSRREVIIEMFPPAPDQPTMQWTKHIDLALWADVMLIAPASANSIAKIAHGMADNFLTSLVLALRCPLVVAPSMDVDMFKNPATQRNLSILRERGCRIIEPATGELASGLTGAGRLPEPDVLVGEVDRILSSRTGDLKGISVLITAGPTQEPIDPVRYIGNRSSGKMGFAIARAAAERGATTTLIAGPVHLDTPPGVRRIDVSTAREMYDAVMKEFPACGLLVMAAAVADFAPVAPAPQKIKRERIDGDRWSIECSKNPDILKAAAERKEHQVVVGFALETTRELDHAREKLAGKKLDLIVLNNPTVKGAGFGAETNVVTLVHADGHAEELPMQSKLGVAHEILNRAVPLLRS